MQINTGNQRLVSVARTWLRGGMGGSWSEKADYRTTYKISNLSHGQLSRRIGRQAAWMLGWRAMRRFVGAATKLLQSVIRPSCQASSVGAVRYQRWRSRQARICSVLARQSR